MEEVTVLVPTYFANSMLHNCLSSLFEKCPGVKILTYKNDVGWLKAANELMRSVTTDVILLNDDTLAVNDIVSALRNMAYSKPEIGIVGGKAISPNENYIMNYGIYVGPDGNTAHRYLGQPRDSVKPEQQQAVEGSLMYIKREVLNKVGYFDEGYGFGFREEVDLCFRARKDGFKVVSTPDAEYIHFVSQTTGRLGIKNTTYDYFMEKWASDLKRGLL